MNKDRERARGNIAGTKPIRTLEQAQTEYDLARLRETISDLNDDARTASQHGNDKWADRKAKQAWALGRLLARMEGQP